MQKKKRQHYNRIIKSIDLSNAKTAWRQLRKSFNLGKSKNMQKKKNTSEDLEKFYSYFKKLNARKQQNEEYIPTRSEALGPLDYEISEQETVTAIDLLKTGKASGVDNICELLIHGKETSKEPLTSLFNKILTSGRYPTLPCGVMA